MSIPCPFSKACLRNFLSLSYRLLWVLWFVFFLFLSLSKIRCYDIWWHLATGRYILNNFTIPRVDPFSYTHSGAPWIDSMWLFQTIVYGIYSVSGYCGLLFLKALILFLAFWQLRSLLKTITQDKALILAIMWSVLLAASFRFTIRPHIAGYLLFVLCWYCLIRLDSELSWKNIILIFLCLVVWVNTHGSFVLGVFLIGVYCLYRLSPFLKEEIKTLWQHDEFRKIVFLACFTLIATTINPYGVKLLHFVLFSHSGESKEALKHIQEWYSVSPGFFFVFSWDKTLFFKILFWSSFGLMFLPIFKGELRHCLWIFYVGGLTYLVLQHYRFAGFFAFGVAPLIALFYEKWYRELQGFARFIINSTLFLAIIFAGQTYGSAIFNPRWSGCVRWELYPKALAEFVKVKHLPQPIFNTYGWGGFLIWELYPEYKVFIDGRTPTVYSTDFYWIFRKAENGNKSVIEYLMKQYQIKTAITGSSKLCRVLRRKFGFRVVGFDDRGYLLVNKNEIPNGVKIFKFYDPCKEFHDQVKKLTGSKGKENGRIKKSLEQIERELNYAITVFPSVKALNNLGVLYSNYREEPTKALKFYQRALTRSPDNYGIYYNIGLCYFDLGNYRQALPYFAKITRKDSQNSRAWLMLAKTYHNLGEYKKAYTAIKKHLTLVGDGATSEAYQYLGMIKNQLYDVSGAARAFKRALLLAKDEKEKAVNYYNLGKCYEAIGDLEQAEKYLSAALNTDPGLKAARKSLNELRNSR